MAHWCETCGQELPEEGNPSDSTWLGAPDAAPPHQHHPARGSVERSGGRDKKILVVLAGIVAVWVLFVIVGRLVSPADQAASDEAPPSDPEAGELEAAEPVDEPDTTYEAADAFPNAPGGESDLGSVGNPQADEFALGDGPDSEIDQLGSRATTSLQVERLQRQLGRRASNALLVYESIEGPVVVDLQAGISVVADLTSGATTADPGLELLRSGSTTYGIDPDTLAVGMIVDDGSIVVTKARPGGTYFVGSSSLQTYAPQIQSLAGDLANDYITPRGYQLGPLDGLGLVAVPKGPSGESLLAGAAGFEVLSSHRVLTGNERALLEQRCQTPITCELVVSDYETGNEWLVPAGFVQLGDNYVLSPDGIQLLRYTPEGFAEVLLSTDASVAWVIGSGMEAPAWGPNSDFIAWLDRVGEPKLKVMFPDERDWLTIDLADLGAPPPLRSELVVFAPPATDI